MDKYTKPEAKIVLLTFRALICISGSSIDDLNSSDDWSGGDIFD